MFWVWGVKGYSVYVLIVVSVFFVIGALPSMLGYMVYYRHQMLDWSLREKFDQYVKFSLAYYASLLLPGMLVIYYGLRMRGMTGAFIGGAFTAVPAVALTISILDMRSNM